MIREPQINNLNGNPQDNGRNNNLQNPEAIFNQSGKLLYLKDMRYF